MSLRRRMMMLKNNVVDDLILFDNGYINPLLGVLLIPKGSDITDVQRVMSPVERQLYGSPQDMGRMGIDTINGCMYKYQDGWAAKSSCYFENAIDLSDYTALEVTFESEAVTSAGLAFGLIDEIINSNDVNTSFPSYKTISYGFTSNMPLQTYSLSLDKQTIDKTHLYFFFRCNSYGQQPSKQLKIYKVVAKKN